ncbi:MAG: MFS transporter [Dehalococcoidia bacterium]|nr:MFS transporter [Dehalococcoidia bacterium]MCA9854613.1 MFS transporter [Dehalococcoidia bacterium]
MLAWFQRTFTALESRSFRTLWFGSFFSMVAFFMSSAAQAIVAFDLTGNNASVGFVIFGQGFAQLFLAPFGGALADRLPKKPLIIFFQAIIMAVFTSIAILIWLDLIAIWHLVTASFITGMSFSFMGPARQAYVVDLVEEGRRGNAVALNQVALNASRVLGPAVAASLIAWEVSGGGGAYMTMAAFYFFTIIATFMLPPSHGGGTQRSVLGDIGGGFQYVAGHPRLRTLIPFFILLIMFGLPYVTIMPGFVKTDLGKGEAGIGLMLAAQAAGGLLASLAVAGLADSPSALKIYSGAGLLFGASLLATSASPNLLAALGAMFVAGIGSGAFQTLNSAVVIRESDPRFFGRVMSLTMTAFAGFALMGLPIGFLADAIGERATLACMGGAIIAVVIVFTLLLSRIPVTPPALPSAEAAG